MKWNATAKVDAFNYKYERPLAAVKIFDDRSPPREVPSRCFPHTNINQFPVAPPEVDYSWIRTAPPVAKNLPDDHALSPKRLREMAKEQQKADVGSVCDSDDRKSTATSCFSSANPNNSSFTTSVKKMGKFGMDKTKGAFGDVEKFTAHKAGGHFSSKTKSLLEITRKDEIELQKQRDIAEAKAKILLSGGTLV